MLLPVIQDALKKAGNMDPVLIQDTCIGNVLQGGAGATSARIAQLLAGMPDTCSLQVCNRQCSSGLQAISTIASQISAGEIDIGMGGGVESMSMFDMMGVVDANCLSDQIFEHDKANKCLMPMGITSENVVEKYGLNRKDLDQMAVDSH